MDITFEEIKEAVFSMHPEKAPGPDGFNPMFFQTYWSIVANDVVQVCREFFDSGTYLQG